MTDLYIVSRPVPDRVNRVRRVKPQQFDDGMRWGGTWPAVESDHRVSEHGCDCRGFRYSGACSHVKALTQVMRPRRWFSRAKARTLTSEILKRLKAIPEVLEVAVPPEEVVTEGDMVGRVVFEVLLDEPGRSGEFTTWHQALECGVHLLFTRG